MHKISADAIAVARKYIGFHESKSGGHYNNGEPFAAQVPGLSWANFQAWCMTFVSFVLYTVGALGKLRPSASVADMMNQGKKLGRWTVYPTRGAIVIYGRNGDTHTGIVKSWTNDTITVIEGNTNNNGSAEGDGVYLKTRPRHSDFVHGYVLPYYDELAVSADPKWNGKWLGAGPQPKQGIPLNFLVGCIKANRKNDVITTVQNWLGLPHTGIWDAKTKAAWIAWQKKCGLTGDDVDGMPGEISLLKLALDHGCFME